MFEEKYLWVGQIQKSKKENKKHSRMATEGLIDYMRNLFYFEDGKFQALGGGMRKHVFLYQLKDNEVLPGSLVRFKVSLATGKITEYDLRYDLPKRVVIHTAISRNLLDDEQRERLVKYYMEMKRV